MALKFEYDKETRTAVVCGVEDKFCEQIVIPSAVEYYRKKYDVAIKEEAFKECLKLKSVTITDGVTKIGRKAFAGCSSLTSVTIPDSVTEIGDGAFSGCKSLISITIPNSVTVIGWYAFEYCSSLTSITIPDSVTEIGVWAFKFCSNLKEFKGKFAADNGRCLIKDGALIAYASASGEVYAIPNGVAKIGVYAFWDCSSLTSVTIPDSVTKIGDSAFCECSSLTSVTIPDSVTSIGDSAFRECSSLTSVTIPDSVTSIGDSAFVYCSSLTSVTIPNGVTKIGQSAFNGCSNLTSVAISDSVAKIGGDVFYGCSSLTSITIPDSVTSIGDSAFSGCSSLKEFKGKFAADNGRCLIIDGALIAYARASCTTYDIPNGVTKIGQSAFSGCSSLTSVTIPDSVTEIGGWAFYGCSSLTSITIPDSVTYIGTRAFRGCSSLKKVEICNEQGSVKIDSLAFELTTKVTYLGKDAQPKPKQEVKEQPVPEVATPAPTIDLDKLIDAAAADGVITDKERSVILKRAVAAGYDADEVEILIDGKIAEKQREAQPKKKGLFARLFGKK